MALIKDEPKEFEAEVTMFIGHGGIEIQIADTHASLRIIDIKMDAGQFCAAVGRLACCKGTAKVYQSVDKIGLKMEVDRIVFQMPGDYKEKHRKEFAYSLAVEEVGAMNANSEYLWAVDNYFDSQDSFFTEDGKTFARATIRRWVPYDKDPNLQVGSSQGRSVSSSSVRQSSS